MISERRKILVIDDEQTVRDSLELLLSKNYSVETAPSGELALQRLRALEGDVGEPFSLVLCDVMMPGMDGLTLLKELRSEFEGKLGALPIIMVTASNNIRNAVEAMKLGAIEYLTKPYDLEELLLLVEKTIQGEVNTPQPYVVSTSNSAFEVVGDFGLLAGKHPLMQEIYSKVAQLAVCDTTVLITGESGTGKELVAQELHRRGLRKSNPFIAINCAAIPESLIESELFGHEKGAFTHAVEKRIGLFELADGGTLFLDEIGELNPHVQVKMLRFLQEHEFYRVGRARPISVNVRVVAATNKNLETAVREGKFRQDLYFRIHVVNLDLPPLRQRKEDIAPLVSHLLKKLAPAYNNKELKLTTDTIEALSRYSWPGNVRELENVLECLLALSPAEEITPHNLPGKIRAEVENDKPQNFEEAGQAFERELILAALRKSEFVQTKAAENLGISRRILKYKMDKLGIADAEH